MPVTEPIWIDRSETNLIELDETIGKFEMECGLSLHWVAQHHLSRGSGRASDPFPRIEEHEGYLFGILYVPSNVGDTFAVFDELVFVATHDRVLGVFERMSSSTTEWPDLYFNLSTNEVFDGDRELGGRTLVRMMKTVVTQLLNDAENFKRQVGEIASDIGMSPAENADELVNDLQMLSHRRRRELHQRAMRNRDVVTRLRKEVPLMRRVITETEQVLERLACDVIDLNQDATGNPRQLFTRDLEIFVSDAFIDARHVTSVMSDIDDRLVQIGDYMKQLRDEESVSASRFTGAIASIMLLPTFIVGLYGQNFGHIPELSWTHGYLFSWGTIVTVTVGQIWFFRRRRWI